MKLLKQLYIFLLMILLGPQMATAQIILSAADYPTLLTGEDSFKVSTNAMWFPSLVGASNGLWDITTLTYLPGADTNYSITALGSGSFADSNTFTVIGLQYQGNEQKALNTGSYRATGVLVHRQALSLFALSGSATDSLTFDEQLASYSRPDTVLRFPASFPGQWATNTTYSLGFYINIPLFLLNNDPGYIKIQQTTLDSVIGWGKVNVIGTDTVHSGLLDVLQIMRYTISSDSFYIDGLPADPTILFSLGLTQGQTDTVVQLDFCQVGQIVPVVSVFYDRATKRPARILSHLQRLLPSGIGEYALSRCLIYPNPVVGNRLNIDLPEGFSNGTYAILNAAGVPVATGALTGITCQLPLPLVMPAGPYVLMVSTKEGATINQQFTIAH